MEDFKDYYGKRVDLLVDGRGYDTLNWGSDANVTLELEATPVSETDKLLNLENICSQNRTPLRGAFTRGAINKDYIIGIFEHSPKQE